MTDGGYRPGVGIMLLDHEGRVLVARRVEPAEDAWQMPQGGIDEGETPRDAVFRELKEELGTDAAEILAESREWLQYDLPPELVGKAWDGRWRGQRQKWFVMRFTGSDGDINLDSDHPEFREWKWISVDQLPELVVSFKRQVYLDLLNEFSTRPPGVSRRLVEIISDPVVRATMAADGTSEEELYRLLRETADKLRQHAGKRRAGRKPTGQ